MGRWGSPADSVARSARGARPCWSACGRSSPSARVPGGGFIRGCAILMDNAW